ncbi:MAG: ROK family protein [Phycisphaerales bacterium]|nr:ROK family protein [Phycisphaerales bacterium]
MNILVCDIGGTSVKVLLSGESERRKVPSGPEMTAADMVEAVKTLAEGWSWDAVSIGYPGPVIHGRVMSEPSNLGPDWIAFDFEKAFGCPVRIVNDAAMQALGSYHGDRMLFMGLGTGLGTAMIVDGVLQPMEAGHLPYKNKKTYEEYVGKRGYAELGKKKWHATVLDVIADFKRALEPDYIVIGGGNAKKIKPDELPDYCELGSNANAFTGGFRLWDDVAKKSETTASAASQ